MSLQPAREAHFTNFEKIEKVHPTSSKLLLYIISFGPPEATSPCKCVWHHRKMKIFKKNERFARTRARLSNPRTCQAEWSRLGEGKMAVPGPNRTGQDKRTRGPDKTVDSRQ